MRRKEYKFCRTRANDLFVAFLRNEKAAVVILGGFE